jgi:pimeloyl-ACP methyl ester carboxylesterase
MTEFQIPGQGEELLRRDDFALVERLWRRWSPDWDSDDEHLRSVTETFRTDETDHVQARADLEVVNRAGHFVYAERPDAVADAILAFVDG